MKITVKNKIGQLDYDVEVSSCKEDLTNQSKMTDFLNELESKMNEVSGRGEWTANSDGLYCELESGETESYLITLAQDYDDDDEKFKGELYYSDSL